MTSPTSRKKPSGHEWASQARINLVRDIRAPASSAEFAADAVSEPE